MTDCVVSQHGSVIVATVLWLVGEERHSATDVWTRSDGAAPRSSINRGTIEDPKQMTDVPDPTAAVIPKAVLASLDQVYALLATLPEPHSIIKEDVEAILAQILARVERWKR